MYPLSEVDLYANESVEQWLVSLARLRTVVCVTARENYRLEAIERMGVTGPLKYAEAGVKFKTEGVPWRVGQ